MSKSFEFVDGGRVFTCTVEASHTAAVEAWWWFRVSTDVLTQRYAPFRRATGDTRENVRSRIIAYYDALLARRAQPAAAGHHWRRGRPAAGANVAAQSPSPGVADASGAPAEGETN